MAKAGATEAKKPAEAPKEIVKPEPTGPTAMIVAPDYGDDVGQGFEGQTKADTSMPMILQLQGLSGAVKDGVANEGDFRHTQSGEIWTRDTGFLVVPAITAHVYGEWTPRKQGGGFHGNREIDDPIVLKAIAESKKFGRYRIDVKEWDEDSGREVDKIHELIETFLIFGVLCDEHGNGVSMISLSFKGTHIKKYKAWNGSAKQLMVKQPDGSRKRPPMFAHLVRVTGVPAKNAKGEFYVPHLRPAIDGNILKSLLDPEDERYQMGRACREIYKSGDADINYQAQQAEPDEPGDEGEGGGSTDGNGDEGKPKGKAPF